MDADSPPADAPLADGRLAELLADVEAVAGDHRDAGRETVVVPPLDVGVLADVTFGLEVLTPPERFADLAGVVDAATLHTSHVYRTDADDARLLIVLQEGTLPATDDAAAADLSMFVPAVLPLPADALAARAREAGVMYTHVRPPADDGRVTFTHEDPSLFF
jgi:hypothetical protein